MSEWKPIHGAPQDGSDILVWDGERAWIAYWSERTIIGHAWFCEDERNYGTMDPLFWTPLPAPPAQ